jgi:putative Holliday junction resolvase
MNNKRIAAIDYGLKRIGIAVSDPSGKMAFPWLTVEGGRKAINNVAKAFETKPGEICRVIVGLPLLMNGKDGDMAIASRKFAVELEAALSIEVVLWDERLSSAQADKNLRELSLNRKKRASKIDTAAATLLLQSYLDSL